MKPLQMLDHVMLWIARGFTISLLAWCSISNIHQPTFSPVLCGYLSVFLLWAIGCWLFAKRFVRIFVGITSALFLSAMTYFVAMGDVTINWRAAEDCLVVAYVVAGTASLMWIAHRGADILSPPMIKDGIVPARRPNRKFSRRPFSSLFSAIPSIPSNSVNSVNSV